MSNTYTVKSGENPWRIVQKMLSEGGAKPSAADIIDMIGLIDKDNPGFKAGHVDKGQVITLPDPSARPAPRIRLTFNETAKARMIQENLLALGHDLGRFGPNRDGVDGNLGGSNSMSRKAIRAFQEDQGFPLTGRLTQVEFERLQAVASEPPVSPPDPENHVEPGRLSVLREAQGLVGQMEVGGDNQGPIVDLVTNGRPGQAWCDRLVGHIFDEVAPEALQASHRGRVADTRAWVANQDAYRPAESGYAPKPGDVVFFKSGGGGHIGIVEEAGPDGSLITIEGNRGEPGSDPRAPWSRDDRDGVRRITYTNGEFENYELLGFGDTDMLMQDLQPARQPGQIAARPGAQPFG